MSSDDNVRFFWAPGPRTGEIKNEKQDNEKIIEDMDGAVRSGAERVLAPRPAEDK